MAARTMIKKPITEDICTAILDLLDVREASIGKPIVDSDAHEALAYEHSKLSPLAKMHTLGGEKRAVALFDYYVLSRASDRLNQILGNDEVVRLVPEYRVPGGACDRAIIHKSGRLTLVEVKDCGSTRDIVSGIGQVLVYAAKAERVTQHHPIVPVLAVLGGHDDDIARACSLGGVEYLPLGDLAFNMALSRIAAIALGQSNASAT